MWIPHWADFNEVVKVLQFNGFKVDDMCTTSRDGKAINIWIPSKDIRNSTLKEKVGSFMRWPDDE